MSKRKCTRTLGRLPLCFHEVIFWSHPNVDMRRRSTCELSLPLVHWMMFLNIELNLPLRTFDKINPHLVEIFPQRHTKSCLCRIDQQWSKSLRCDTRFEARERSWVQQRQSQSHKFSFSLSITLKTDRKINANNLGERETLSNIELSSAGSLWEKHENLFH